MAVEPRFAPTVDKYQGKTAIPLIVRIGKNPRRDVTMPMFLVMLSRVTRGSDLGISPILDGDNLSHLLMLQWSENLYLFMNAFNPSTGKLSLPHLKAAQISFANQRRANNEESSTTTSSIQHSNEPRANNGENSTMSSRVQHTPAESRRRPAEINSGILESQPPQRIRRNNQNSSRNSPTHSTNVNSNPPQRIRRNNRNSSTSGSTRSTSSNLNDQRQLSSNLVTQQFISETTVPLFNQPYGPNVMIQVNVPDTRVHLSTSGYTEFAMATYIGEAIYTLTDSWLLVPLFREAMGYPRDLYGAVIWSRPHNWEDIVSHYNFKFSISNIQLPWNNHGYINANIQDTLLALGDADIITRLSTYMMNCKAWFIFRRSGILYYNVHVTEHPSSIN